MIINKVILYSPGIKKIQEETFLKTILVCMPLPEKVEQSFFSKFLQFVWIYPQIRPDSRTIRIIAFKLAD